MNSRPLLACTDNEHYRDFYKFGYLVGWRRNACAKLEWSSVNRHAGEITLPWKLDKTRVGNKLPIGKKGTTLHDLIERRWELRTYEKEDGTTAMSQYVFHVDGVPIGDIRKAWATACRAPRRCIARARAARARSLRRRMTRA